MDKRGRHQNHCRGQKVKRIKISCGFCGTIREFLPGFLRVHPQKYCSRKCMGSAKRTRPIKEVLFCTRQKIETICTYCNEIFLKRHDLIKERNFCSKKCTGNSRKKKIKKWSDKEYAKSYLRQYHKTHKRKKDWQKENRERSLIIKKRYRDSHKDKIAVHYRFRKNKTNNNLISETDWQNSKKLFNYKCACCDKVKKLTLDHIIPLALGGQHAKDNIQPLCKSCNSRKHIKIIDFRYKRMLCAPKSEITRKHPVYRLKKKLLFATQSIEIQEV